MATYYTKDQMDALAAVIGQYIAEASFLPVADNTDTSDATFFYFGWADVNGGWLIQRHDRATSAYVSSTAGHADLSTAWPDRANLTYA